MIDELESPLHRLVFRLSLIAVPFQELQETHVAYLIVGIEFVAKSIVHTTLVCKA
jgi:hypothetical protein